MSENKDRLWAVKPLQNPPTAIEFSSLDESMVDVLVRLLKAMLDPTDVRVLGHSLVREIHYRLIASGHGETIRSTLGFKGNFSRISRALSETHAHYADKLHIPNLAEAVGMSQSVFHLHFKKITSTSPIQSIKAFRLNRARNLIWTRESERQKLRRAVSPSKGPSRRSHVLNAARRFTLHGRAAKL